VLCYHSTEIVDMCKSSLQDAGMYTLHSSVLFFYVVPASFRIRKSRMVPDFLLPFPSTDHSK